METTGQSIAAVAGPIDGVAAEKSFNTQMRLDLGRKNKVRSAAA
jgi:hypothetical protein